MWWQSADWLTIVTQSVAVRAVGEERQHHRWVAAIWGCDEGCVALPIPVVHVHPGLCGQDLCDPGHITSLRGVIQGAATRHDSEYYMTQLWAINVVDFFTNQYMQQTFCFIYGSIK